MKQTIQKMSAFTLVAACSVGFGLVSCKKSSRNTEVPFQNLTLDLFDSYTNGDNGNYCPIANFNFSGHLANQQCNNGNNFDFAEDDDEYYTFGGQQVGLCEYKTAITYVANGLTQFEIRTIPILFDCGTGNLSLFPFLYELDDEFDLLNLELDCNEAGDTVQVDVTCNVGTELYTESKTLTCLAAEQC